MFKLVSKYKPSEDQPEVIKELVKEIKIDFLKLPLLTFNNIYL